MAMTQASARPDIDCAGTIGAGLRGGWNRCGAVAGLGEALASVIDVERAVGEDHAPRVDLLHQSEIVGRDDDGGA